MERVQTGRWICMAATLVVCVCAGFGYAWSVLQMPIVSTYGWPESQVSLVYTVTVLCSTLTPLFFGGLVGRMSTRRCVMVGAVLFGGGLFLTGTMAHIWQLVLFYGVCSGVGCGLIYPCLMAYVIKLFPRQSGLASGLGTAAYASGAVLWAPTAVALMKTFSLGQTFRILGAGILIVILVSALFLREPQEQPDGAGDGAAAESTGLRRGEMVRTPTFYLTAAAVAFGLTAGVIVISQASPILQQTLSFSASQAAVGVSAFSVCNMAGRFLWGSVSDKVGITKTMGAVFLLCILSMLVLAVTSAPVLVLAAMGLGASCYGGFSSVITPFTAQLFGRKYITENYGVMYIVFGIASLIGPVLAVGFKATGGYTGAFLSAAVLAAVGLVLSRLIRVKR